MAEGSTGAATWTNRPHRRWKLCGAPLLLALLAIAVAGAWLKPLDDMATAQAQAGFKRAVASFATARALNAVISVVQGTEFSVQPLGIGVTLTPGQMLDPLNDLVERFSDLMLMASVAFGVQLLLLEIGVHWGMSLLLSLAAVAWAWAYLKRKRPSALLGRVLVALLLVRFIVPLAGMASDIVYKGFMQDQYAASQQGIEQSSQAIGALVPAEGRCQPEVVAVQQAPRAAWRHHRQHRRAHHPPHRGIPPANPDPAAGGVLDPPAHRPHGDLRRCGKLARDGTATFGESQPLEYGGKCGLFRLQPGAVM
ncbi:MAG: hypothetical protein M5R42_17910 [Rhodocyclaceae bacterium]|nr:hypothetical protein [Rhodocyclaceae bacterium]